MDTAAGTCPMHDIHQFDMYDPDYVQAMYDVFARMHEHGGLTRAEPYGGWWIITGHDEVFEAARDYKTFSRQTEFPTHCSTKDGTRIPPDPANEIMLRTLISIDPPRHKGYRLNLNPHFTPAVVAASEERIREQANVLIDAFIEKGSCDIWLDYAQPLAHIVIFAEVLNLPIERIPELFAIIDALPPSPGGHSVDELLASMAEFVATYVDERRQQPPKGDVIDTLLAAEFEGGKLDLDVVVANVVLILAAGVETTGSIVATSLHHLAQDHDLRRRLAAEPALVEKACEEFLRMYGSVQLQPRTVMKDTELGGQQLKAGDHVLLAYAAASRDPKLYECPGEFRLKRDTSHHVAFGLGAHRCIGSNLARLEFRIALEEFLARIPEYAPVEGWEYRRKIDHIQGPIDFPVTFAPGAQRAGVPAGAGAA